MRLRHLCLLLLAVGLLLSTRAVADTPYTVHVAPFTAGPTTSALAEAMFDGFVDQLDLDGPQRGVEVKIIKVPLSEVNPGWLAKQTWVTGAVTDYAEDAGCCFTQFTVRARIETHQPGGSEPLLLDLDDEGFFNHDLSKLADEQQVVGDRLGRSLARRWLKAFARR